MTRVVVGCITIPVSGLNGAGSCGAVGVVPYVLAIGNRAVCVAEERLVCTSLLWAEACNARAVRGATVACGARRVDGTAVTCGALVVREEAVACGGPTEADGTVACGAP